MYFKLFKTCEDFIDYYEKRDLSDDFSLTKEYLVKDSMYLDDDIIQWIVVEDTAGYPLAFIALKLKQKTIENCAHISVFEVNKKIRGEGYGTKIMKRLIESLSENIVALYAEDKNRSFYENLGFIKDFSVENRYVLEK